MSSCTRTSRVAAFLNCANDKFVCKKGIAKPEGCTALLPSNPDATEDRSPNVIEPSRKETRAEMLARIRSLATAAAAADAADLPPARVLRARCTAEERETRVLAWMEQGRPRDTAEMQANKECRRR